MRVCTSAMRLLLLYCIDKAVNTFILKGCSSRFGWLAQTGTGGSEGKRLPDGHYSCPSMNHRWAGAGADDRSWMAHHQSMTALRLSDIDSSASEILSHNLTITIVTGNLRK